MKVLRFLLYIQLLSVVICLEEAELQHTLKQYIKTKKDIDERNEKGETLLHIAADKGYLNSVKELISLKADVNTRRGKDEKTALNIAALNGNKDIVHLLLKHGADPELGDAQDRTPLYSAAVGGHLDIIKTLVQFNAKVDTTRDFGATALYQAAYNGNLEIVKYLLEKAPQLLNKAKDSGATPFYISAFSGKLQVLKYLYEKGANYAKTKENGMTPLIIACEQGHIAVIQFLIQEVKVDVNQARDNGQTALYSAASNGNKPVVELLLASNANVNVLTNEQETPLYTAVYYQRWDLVELLLAKNADVTIARYDKWTALHVACVHGHLPTVKRLVEGGANVKTAYTNQNVLPFMLAAQHGHLDVLKFLLEEVYYYRATSSGEIKLKTLEDKSVDDLDTQGHSALYEATVNGHTEVVKYLLAIGASQYSGKAYHLYPLIAAAQYQYKDIISLFMKYRDIELNSDEDMNNCVIQDDKGFTYFHYAVLKSQVSPGEKVVYDTSEVIMNHSTRCGTLLANNKSNDGLTPLHIAAMSQNLQIASTLIRDLGADVNARDRDGETPVLMATEQGDLSMVRLLTENNADLNRCSFTNLACPLHTAVLFGHTNIVQYLVQQNNKVNIDQVDGDLESAVFIAVQPHFHHWSTGQVYTDVVGVKKQVSMDEEYTLLNTASEDDYFNILKTLVHHGANLSLKRSDGKTAGQVAQATGNLKAYKFIQDIVSVRNGKQNFNSETIDDQESDEKASVFNKGEKNIEQSLDFINNMDFNTIALIIVILILVAMAPGIAFKISCMLDGGGAGDGMRVGEKRKVNEGRVINSRRDSPKKSTPDWSIDNSVTGSDRVATRGDFQGLKMELRDLVQELNGTSSSEEEEDVHINKQMSREVKEMKVSADDSENLEYFENLQSEKASDLTEFPAPSPRTGALHRNTGVQKRRGNRDILNTESITKQSQRDESHLSKAEHSTSSTSLVQSNSDNNNISEHFAAGNKDHDMVSSHTAVADDFLANLTRQQYGGGQTLNVNVVNVHHHHSSGSDTAASDPYKNPQDMVLFHNAEKNISVQGYSPYVWRCCVQNQHSRILSNLSDSDILAAHLFQIEAMDDITLQRINQSDFKKNSILLEYLYKQPAWKWAKTFAEFIQENQPYLVEVILSTADKHERKEKELMGGDEADARARIEH